MDKKLEKIREQLAKYIASEGCSCCRNDQPHKEAEEELAKMLKVGMYEDGSDYNWYQYVPSGNG